uniref:Uncharacterized protein n=1 Tax=Fagus sylvatica TaxID=28930 RepID=A0A2N9H4E8_FAGSY
MVKQPKGMMKAVDLAWRTAIGFGCDYGGGFRPGQGRRQRI